jgi:hypothetical protein
LASAIAAPCCELLHCEFSAVWHDAHALDPTNEGSGGSAVARDARFVRVASPKAASATAATAMAPAAKGRTREWRRRPLDVGADVLAWLERAVRGRRFFATAPWIRVDPPAVMLPRISAPGIRPRS